MPTLVRRLPLALFSLLLLPGVLRAQDTDAEWLARCRTEGGDRARHCEVRVVDLDARSRLVVDGGRNGGAVVRGGDREGIEVHARIQARAESEAEARELAKNVRIETGSVVRAVGPPPLEGRSWTALFVVDAPRRIDLEMSTRNGPLGVERVAGTIRLETRNGPVALEDVAGDVEARTRNGPVSVELGGTRWEGAGLDAETRNGPVTLTVPADYSAELETGTENGPVDLAFPLTVAIDGRRPLERIRTTLGEGGAPVRVVTTNGPLSLRRR